MRRGCFTFALVFALLALAPPEVEAFCGFYVSGADAKLYNNATMVVLMREGMRTVLSMQNNYEGPPQDFAMVVPVPSILQKENVKTLPSEVFDKVDRLASPRLVEYWEQDPCVARSSGGVDDILSGLGSSGLRRAVGAEASGVTIKAQFKVGEYEVVILSATEALGLEAWLKEHDYNIPDGASEVLRPYIAAGMYFFVARVDTNKVTFGADGQATLSPLRFHYDSKVFRLPVRLGLLNAKGRQDLLIHILARNTRYEAANAPNVTLPTNLIVPNATRSRFGEFYTTLLDRTLEKRPGAVVTEYSWNSGNCDPCPGPPLHHQDLLTLGADVVPEPDEVAPQAKTRAVVQLAPTAVQGRDRSAVQRVLGRRGRTLLQPCYSPDIAKRVRRPQIRARLTFTINPAGRVVTSRVENAPDSIATCVERRVKRLRFPATRAAGMAQVDVNLLLLVIGDRAPAMRPNTWTLTRLHARYDAQSLKRDLVFRRAAPISGGRGVPQGEQGELAERGANKSTLNTFQGRYIILNPWEGPLTCAQPQRGHWGGAPPRFVPQPTGDPPSPEPEPPAELEPTPEPPAKDPSEATLEPTTDQEKPTDSPAPTPPPPEAEGSAACHPVRGRPGGGWWLWGAFVVGLLALRRTRTT